MKLEKTNKAEQLSLDKDEKNLQGPFQIINSTDKDRTQLCLNQNHYQKK